MDIIALCNIACFRDYFDGSFRCECPEGFTYNDETHQCVDVDECADNEVCAGGKCTNTDGGFQCECPPDWRLSTDGTYCISDAPGRCYTQIENQMCSAPLAALRTKSQCCCVKVESGQETLGKCFAAIGKEAVRCAAVDSPEYRKQCDGFEGNTGGPHGVDICNIMGNNITN